MLAQDIYSAHTTLFIKHLLCTRDDAFNICATVSFMAFCSTELGTSGGQGLGELFDCHLSPVLNMVPGMELPLAECLGPLCNELMTLCNQSTPLSCHTLSPYMALFSGALVAASSTRHLFPYLLTVQFPATMSAP